jgi:hypothetical protein
MSFPCGWYVDPSCEMPILAVAIGAIVWPVSLIKTILTDRMQFIVPIQASLLLSPSTHTGVGDAGFGSHPLRLTSRRSPERVPKTIEATNEEKNDLQTIQ